jgi:hypothetical protein
MSTSQKYILDDNDELLSSLLTPENKTNLNAGGLFDDIVLNDAVPNLSVDVSNRNLVRTDESVAIDWENDTLQGDWGVTGNVAITGEFGVAGNVAVTGDLSATDVSGNFSGTFDFSSVDESAALSLFQTANVNTDAIPEGDTNKYYTDDKVLSVVSTELGNLVETSNAIHVNKNQGTDIRDNFQKYDFINPFATIVAAKSVATAGDTILVWPGNYVDEYDLLKNGVDYFFMPGSSVTQTSASVSAQPIFRDSAALTSNVYGYGSFITNSTVNKSVISITDSASKVKIQSVKIESTTATNIEYVVSHDAGALEIESRKIISSGLGVKTSSDTLIIKNSYVVAAEGSAIEVKGVNCFCFIDNCQLETTRTNNDSGAIFVYPNSSGLRIKNNILITASDYSIVTATGQSCVISVLAGNTANKPIADGNSGTGVVVTEELAPFTIDDNFSLTIF